MNETVFMKQLAAERPQGALSDFSPLGDEMKAEIGNAVKEIFDRFGGGSLLKSSRDVYIKPNAIDAKPYTHTRAEVVEAVIRYWFDAGARKIYLIENSTQCIYTRVVFERTGYNKICKRTGAIPVYLDEDEVVTLKFPGKRSVKDGDEEGYDLTEFGMPRTVAKNLIDDRDKNLYINLPKLKTHSMGVVTLGIKNQWGFPSQGDRSADHNYNLHSKLVDVLSHVQPDFTLIEGIEGTIYGHYPPLALAEKCIKPFNILIGGPNVVAVDIAGAAVFGFSIEDVPQIKIAIERGLSGNIKTVEDIELVGDYSDLKNIDIIGDMAEYGGKYPFDLYPEFPEDIDIIKGTEKACREGCVNNTLACLQNFMCDFGGKGGWTLMMGKGFDRDKIDGVKGPVLIAGKCAINEVADELINRLGKRKVYLSGECNDLKATVQAMCHIMRLNPMKLLPMNPIKRTLLFLQASLLHGSHAKFVNPACHIFKLQ